MLAVGSLLGVAAGCGGSSASEAQTPASARTVTNSAPQGSTAGSQGSSTVGQGSTSASGAGGGGSQTTATGGSSGGGGSAGGGGTTGDVAAGKAFFVQTCQGCHLQAGTAAGGIGPKLQGLPGLDAQRARKQVINGGGAMPAGLATGKDLDNVVAYVVSLQK